jgi:hypothetical protein
MTHDYEPDPLLVALTRLPSASPTAAADQRISARCHAALAQRRAARQRAMRSKLVLTRLVDAALAAVLCAYAAVALAEAFRLFQ